MAHLHFQEKKKSVRFVPMTVYKQHMPEELELKGSETVYLCDWAGRPGFAVGVAKLCRRVVVLDHHKTAQEDIGPQENRPSNMHVTFDMNRSGASITRDHFNLTRKLPESVAKMVNIVEDADLWRWTIPEGKPFYAYLGSLKLDFDVNQNPRIFDDLLNLDVNEAVAKGRTILKDQDEAIEGRLKDTFEICIGGAGSTYGRCLAVRGDGLQDLRSEMGNRLAGRSAAAGLRGVSCIAYIEPAMNDDSKIKLSFRGIGTEDTTPFVKEFGGGGHAKASSCVVALDVFEAWKVSEQEMDKKRRRESSD